MTAYHTNTGDNALSQRAIQLLIWLDDANCLFSQVDPSTVQLKLQQLADEWGVDIDSLPAEAALRCRADATLDTCDPEFAEEWAHRHSEAVREIVGKLIQAEYA